MLNESRGVLLLLALSSGCVEGPDVDTSASPLVVIPEVAPTPAFTPVIVNDDPGDQSLPSLDGDLVAYFTDELVAGRLSPRVHYYRFSTGVDAVIPTPAASYDVEPSASGSRIVFRRVFDAAFPPTSVIMLFDTATATTVQIDATPGANQFFPSIGGDTVVYLDQAGVIDPPDLIVHDLASGVAVVLVEDAQAGDWMAVSPDGTVVAWSACPPANDCEVYTAVRTTPAGDANPAWTTTVVTSNLLNDHMPDTNGSVVAWTSGIFLGVVNWAPVGGGEVSALQLDGLSGYVRTDGRFLSYARLPALAVQSDLFLYDTQSNLEYRITDTPLVWEQWDDISVLPNGDVRLVWTTIPLVGDSSTQDVLSATITLPPVDDDDDCHGHHGHHGHQHGRHGGQRGNHDGQHEYDDDDCADDGHGDDR